MPSGEPFDASPRVGAMNENEQRRRNAREACQRGFRIIEHNIQVTQRLLEIFPREVWVEILTKIKDENDKKNTYNTAVLFQLLLPDRRFLARRIFSRR